MNGKKGGRTKVGEAETPLTKLIPAIAQDRQGSWERVKIGETRVRGIVNLAWLQTEFRQGDPFQKLPVYVTVSCGRPSLRISDATFELATWQVLVRWSLENAVVSFKSRRKIQAHEGTIKSEAISKTVLMNVKEHQAALGLDLSLKGSTSSVGFAGSLFGKFLRNRKRTQTTTDTSTTRSTPDIFIVGPFGEAIAIGDPNYGDPHKPYGLLSHEYPSESGDNAEPLFMIEPLDAALPMRISVIAAIPFSKLHFESINAGEAEQKAARDEIDSRGSEVIEELRSQMLRDEFQTRVSRNQQKAEFPVPEGEFAVMAETFEIRRRPA
ncbi:hypothetical protein [Bradyrhizobium sp. S3.5.5]|uniref:hypothetical protein n=1 Tax=Bradyrhizobium sp. S3.5.5 TaxID=3156430 RepID=UPI0033958E16